jgi:hypothetical protein
MKLEWGYLFGMVLQTVPQPRKIAREIQNLAYPRRVLWQVLLLLLVAATFLGVISSILFPADPETFGVVLTSPVLTGIAQGIVAVLSVYAIYWIGRAMGGVGSFDQALLTVIWLQFVLLIVELGVVFLGVFAPGLALMLWVMGMVLTFWILSHFIAEMHAFRSAGAVFVSIFMLMLILAIAMSLVIAVVGLGVPAETGEF